MCIRDRITTMYTDIGMDTGDMLLKAETPIGAVSYTHLWVRIEATRAAISCGLPAPSTMVVLSLSTLT